MGSVCGVCAFLLSFTFLVYYEEIKAPYRMALFLDGPGDLGDNLQSESLFMVFFGLIS